MQTFLKIRVSEKLNTGKREAAISLCGRTADWEKGEISKPDKNKILDFAQKFPPDFFYPPKR